MISICLLKLCCDAIWKPLEIILKTCLRNVRFPLEWKKANDVPIHTKDNKQTIKNYGPVSLLPIYEKIFRRLLYYTMFNFFQRITYFLQINLDADMEILISINFFQLIMKRLVFLIWGAKFVGYSLIYPKLLTKYGMID